MKLEAQKIFVDTKKMVYSSLFLGILYFVLINEIKGKILLLKTNIFCI